MKNIFFRNYFFCVSLAWSLSINYFELRRLFLSSTIFVLSFIYTIQITDCSEDFTKTIFCKPFLSNDPSNMRQLWHFSTWRTKLDIRIRSWASLRMFHPFAFDNSNMPDKKIWLWVQDNLTCNIKHSEALAQTSVFLWRNLYRVILTQTEAVAQVFTPS